MHASVHGNRSFPEHGARGVSLWLLSLRTLAPHRAGGPALSDIEKTVPLSMTSATSSGEQAHYLVVIGGADVGRTIELGSSPVTIGRSDDADETFADPAMSGMHCRVRLVAGQALVDDTGSTNGVFVEEGRVEGAALLPVGKIVRAGNTLFGHERRSRAEVEKHVLLQTELEQAAAYVRALLPTTLSGGPVHSAYRFAPCAHLGGDAFGHHRLGDGRFAFYLLDVCGHGPGAALHSVSVMNVLRRETLREADFGSPAQVLAAVNDAFQMDDHDGRFLTLWYGVYDDATRELRYATAGHPPALRRSIDGAVSDLPASGVAIGMMDGLDYDEESVTLAPGDSVYLYSDGVFEVFTEDGQVWSREAFAEVVAEAGPDAPLAHEPARLERRVRETMSANAFEDDFSLLVCRFV